MLRRNLLLALALAGIQAPTTWRAASADPVTLADSTTTDAWTLANGLRVVARRVPLSVGVAITVAYDTGGDQDPAGHEGMAALVAEVDFLSAAGDQPERTRAEMSSLRPLGWEVKTTPRLSQLSEVASVAQFPGVLHQVAARMRGVTITETSLQNATESARRSLEGSYAGRVDVALATGVRALAVGTSAATVERYATGKGLIGIGIKDVRQRIASQYVPANAVLSIAGNFGEVDLRRVIEREFGAVPAGAKERGSSHPRPASSSASRVQAGLNEPCAVIGVIGPALSDSLHPSFYLNALLYGSFIKTRWPAPAPPFTSRFQYVMLDEPDLACYFPPASFDPADSLGIAEEFSVALREMPGSNADESVYERLRRGAGWLLGGPFPAPLLKRVRSEPGMLLTLASSMATRGLWGNEAFWTTYRQRFDHALQTDWAYWRGYFDAPKHQVRLRFLPAGK